MTEPYRNKEYETILAWTEDKIGFIKLNRPKVYNAINGDLIAECQEILDLYIKDNTVRVIIMMGNEKAFAAGGDIKGMLKATPFEAIDSLRKTNHFFNCIEDCPKPVIAAVNGLALGGGLELALACDLHVIAENATLGLPEINIGVFPGAGGTQRLPRHTSICRVKQYIFTGEFFDAQTALKLGIANMVVPSDEVLPAAKKLARKLANKSPLALREAKNAINLSMYLDIKSGSRAEQLGWSLLFSSNDQKEGMNAFLEQRKAVFKGN